MNYGIHVIIVISVVTPCNELFQECNTNRNDQGSDANFVPVELSEGRVVLVDVPVDDIDNMVNDFDPGNYSPPSSPPQLEDMDGNVPNGNFPNGGDEPNENPDDFVEPLQIDLYPNQRLTSFVQDFVRRCNKRRMNKAQRKEMWSMVGDWQFFDPIEMQSYDTLERKLKAALPSPTVHWRVRNMATGKIYCGRGKAFPEKKFRNKRLYETLCIWTRVHLKDLIRFHAGQHPQADFIVDGKINFRKVHFNFTYDGIPNGKSSPDNLNVMGIQFRGCKQVYIPCVRVARRREIKNLSKFLDRFVQQCLTLGVHVDFFLADAPMRSFIKCLKGHAGRFSCEYCEAMGECVHKKICYPRSTMNQRKRTHGQWVGQVEELERRRIDDRVDNVVGVTGRSPLLKLPGFDMIKSAPSDPLHRDWLGICKSTLWRNTVGISKAGVMSATGKRIADRVGEVYRKLSLPTEFSHRARPIDYANYKGHEWKSMTVSTFPTICEVVEEEIDHATAHVWLLFVYLVLVYSGPQWAMDKIGENYLQVLHELLYEQFEDAFGQQSCSFNWHAFSHMADIRKSGTSTQISTEVYESAYGEVQVAYRSGTRNIGLQIVTNMMVKRMTHQQGKGCQNHFAIQPRTKDVRYDDSIVMDEMYNYYRVVAVEEDLIAVRKIETGPWNSPVDSNLPMHLAGVFKYIGTMDTESLLRRENVCGKAIVTEDNVIIPFYKDLLFS